MDFLPVLLLLMVLLKRRDVPTNLVVLHWFLVVLKLIYESLLSRCFLSLELLLRLEPLKPLKLVVPMKRSQISELIGDRLRLIRIEAIIDLGHRFSTESQQI